MASDLLPREEEDSDLNQESFLAAVQHASNSELSRLDDTASTDSSSSFSMRKWIDTRQFRSGLVSSILLCWTVLILPFDIWGASNHWESLHIWLAAHLAVFIASSIVLALSIPWTADTKCFERYKEWLQIITIVLLLCGTVLQISGAVVYSYQYCSFVALDDDPLWSACISDSYGIVH